MSIEDDRIEQLKRKLYSRNEEPLLDVRTRVEPKDIPFQNSWGKDDTLIIPDDMAKKNMHPFLKKFLLFAGLFFVLSVAVSAYVFFGGNNSVSSSNVDIQVSGPSIVASGEEVDLSVSILNKNRTDMGLVQWTIDYPNGSYADKDSTSVLNHTEETIGNIAKGSSADRTIKLFLFGDKDAKKTIILKLKYQVTGSNAIFTKEKDYDITIGSSPVIVNVTAPPQISSGQKITLHSTITSNSSALLHNVLVLVQYPYGFKFDSSSVDSVKGNNALWNLGDLKSGDKKNIDIVGSIVAQDGEQRTFQISVGTKSADPNKDIDAVLGQVNQTVTVSKPPINSKILISDSDSDSVFTQAGQNVSGVVSFTNTLSDRLNNVSVNLKLSGSALDVASVRADNGGFYQSGNGTISWDKNSTDSLTAVDPGDKVDLRFSFVTKKLSNSEKNPNVVLNSLVKATHTPVAGASESLNSSDSVTVKISSGFSLISKTLRGGAFSNTGPVPPKSGTATTYTINWALSNSWNDLSGAKIVTTLPAYVDWTGQVSPATSNITYNPDNRTVTWSPDTVSAGSGFVSSPREVSFQVKLNSSLSQVGSSPLLTNQTSVSATDNYSGQNISFSSQGLTTQTSDSNISGSVIK
jgi:Domain of unknown function DUF11